MMVADLEERVAKLEYSFLEMKDSVNDLMSMAERTTIIGHPKEDNKVKLLSQTHS